MYHKQFVYKKGTGCLNVSFLIWETVANCNIEHKDAYCTMDGFSDACDRKNNCILFEKKIKKILACLVVSSIQLRLLAKLL